MTYRDKLKIDHPNWSEEEYEIRLASDCPAEHGYPDMDACDGGCTSCWNREVEQPKEETKMIYAHTNMETVSDENDTIEGKFTIAKPVIKDSGNRREFESGAVRDMQEGKGRCDLMPLEVVAKCLTPTANLENPDLVIGNIALFQTSGYNNTFYLYQALHYFAEKAYNGCIATMLLEVAKHFEEGAKKYKEDNWRFGIPVKCYIDSAVRHYMKWHRGDNDEPHSRAFVWNLMCCIWEANFSEDWRNNRETECT